MLDMEVFFDFDDYRKKLNHLSKSKWLVPFLMEVGSELQARVSEYPPATSANRPKRGTTHYQRGLGPVYTTLKGKASKRLISEQLGRKWDILRSGKSVLVRNKAGYSAFVHSRAKQASFHKQRGWKTELDAWEELLRDGTLVELLDDYVGRMN